jgi:chromosome segregation protein
MFLRELAIKGFKSFADPVRLRFEPGLSVVVGPNGSGKSNIVDALAWVLGSQTPSALRLGRGEADGVIFAGSPARPPLGRAEVSVTLDNADGVLPMAAKEVVITRSVDRAGEVEYAINGARCRLLDVQELLQAAGVGRQQHVIVGQGRLDEVLNWKPEARRAVLEEAAGVMLARHRRALAERRLAEADEHLQVAESHLRQIKRRMRPLERQASAARLHDVIATELLELRRGLAVRDHEVLRGRIDALEAELVDLEARRQDLEVRRRALEDELQDVRSRLLELRDAPLHALVERAVGLAARAEGLVLVLGERDRVVDARRRALEAEVDELVRALERCEDEQGQLDALEGELAATEAARQAIEAEVAELANRADAEMRAVEARLAHAMSRDAASPARLADVAEGRSPHPRLALRELQVRSEELARLLARDREAHAEATAQVVRLTEQLDTTRGRLAASEARVAELESRLGDLDRRANEAERAEHAARVELEEAEVARRIAGEQRARAESEYAALAELAGAVVERPSGEGVLGILTELVEVDPGFERAFRASVLGRSRGVVARDAEAGLQLLCHPGAADQAEGRRARAVLVASWPERGQLERERFGTEASLLIDHVRSSSDDPAVTSVLRSLLGRVVVCPDRARAASLALEHPEAVVVTPEGDRFEGGAWWLCAVRHDLDARLAEAGDVLMRNRDAESAADARLAEAKEELAWRVKALRELNEQLDEQAAALRAERQLVVDARRLVEQLHGELDRARAQAAKLAERLKADEAALRSLDDERARVETAATNAAALLDELRARQGLLAEAREREAALRRELELGRVALGERRSVLASALEARERQLALLDSKGAARASDADGDEPVVDELAPSLANLLARVARGARALVSRVKGQAELLERVRQELGSRLERGEAGRSALASELDELERRREAAALEATECRVRLEDLEVMARRELGFELDATTPVPNLPDDAEAQVDALRRRLEELGPVNPLALDELAALEEEAAELERQAGDARAARREVAELLSSIDAEVSSRFAATFAEVNDRFGETIATLFGGGSGRLVLSQPEDLLSTGVELEARLPGKAVRRVSLLSGGERSLVALAFLFAVFKSRPAPFYVLDEVEAALDDVNLGRFLALLRSVRGAQFIVITHQKRTMEAARVLYGVTMGRDGASKVVSQRFDEGDGLALGA